MPTLIATEFEDLQLYARGKVRDLYAVGDLLLLVATDRISAFDHVLADGHTRQRPRTDANFSLLV